MVNWDFRVNFSDLSDSERCIGQGVLEAKIPPLFSYFGFGISFGKKKWADTGESSHHSWVHWELKDLALP